MRNRINFVTIFMLLAGLFAWAAPSTPVQAEGEPLLIGMEAAYPPYNWTQSDDSNNAVPIKGSNEFANGYDVQIARRIGEALGRPVEIVKTEWDGLVPALQSNKIDLIIAGMSPTEERAKVIDFSDPYYQIHFVMVMKKDSPFAEAKGIEDFEGAKVSGQLATLHYDLLDQLAGADVQQAMKNFPAMRVALQSGKLDAYVSEVPEALSATNALDDLTYVVLDPSFDAPQEDTVIAVGVKQGNQELLDAVNEALAAISEEEREQIMEEVIGFQPAAVNE